MKIEEIRKIARETDVAKYFKSMYQHSVRVLESLSEDKIKDIFRTRIESDCYGQTEAIAFYEGKNSTRLDVWVVYDYDDGSDVDEQFDVEPFFDYRGLTMIFYFNDKAESIEFLIDFNIDDKNEPFLNSLTASNYLKTIFGEYLIESDTSKFRVSIKWFED